MKRLTFKPEFVGPIRDRKKRATMRWTNKKLHVGDVVAAVTKRKNTPAFLVPAAEGFAQLVITDVRLVAFKDVTDAMLEACGVTRDWYLREVPDATDFTPIYYYEWDLQEAAE